MSHSEKRNHLCDANNSCLIIIDIQGKLSAAIPEKVTNRLRNNTSILITAANQLNIPIIATAQYPKGLGPIEEFITTSLSDSARKFDKTCFSCLGAEGLSEYLTNLNKRQIILLGIEAHICVLQSAFELMAEGYEVFVVTDATGSRKLSSYDIALSRMNQSCVNLLTTESVLFEWLRDATHPQFKSLSKLIV